MTSPGAPALLVVDLQVGPLREHPELQPVATRILEHAQHHRAVRTSSRRRRRTRA